MAEFRKAIEHGVADNCPHQYTCKKENIKNFLKEEGKWKYTELIIDTLEEPIVFVGCSQK